MGTEERFHEHFALIYKNQWAGKPCFDANRKTIVSMLDERKLLKIDNLGVNSQRLKRFDSHQLLVKSTLSPQLKQVLTVGEKDIKRQWDY